MALQLSLVVAFITFAAVNAANTTISATPHIQEHVNKHIVFNDMIVFVCYWLVTVPLSVLIFCLYFSAFYAIVGLCRKCRTVMNKTN